MVTMLVRLHFIEFVFGIPHANSAIYAAAMAELSRQCNNKIRINKTWSLGNMITMYMCKIKLFMHLFLDINKI